MAQVATPQSSNGRPLTTALEHAWALLHAEQRLGRPLTLAERNIDIVGLDRDLKQGKARLAAEVEREKRRALNSYFRYKRTIRLDVTERMVTILRSLYRTGAKHAHREVEQLAGVKLPRSYSEKNDIEALTAKLKKQLHPLETKVVTKAVSADIGSIAQVAAVRTVLQMPGALNVASQLVSSAVFMGLGSVYDENAGLFGGWTYSAVMDENTCDECEAHDGEEFNSWDEIMEMLPDGGPNPDCFGEGRCRCRAVPSSLSTEGALAGEGGGLLPGPSEAIIGEGEILGPETEGLAGLGPGQPLLSFAETSDYKAFNAAVGESARPGFLTEHTEAEIKQGRAFLSQDGKTGFFISDTGDLQNVFRNPGGIKGSGALAVQRAVQLGARTLDAYDGFLPGLYEDAGFRVVGRMAWKDEFAPSGWDYETYGRPDVVFMAYQPTTDEIVLFSDWEKAKVYSFDVSTKAEPLGAPPPEFKGLPKHAQQPVATLTVAEAQQQIKKLQGNIRGLHWHAKQGKPLNVEKLTVYETRIDQLNAYIASGAAPARVVTRAAAPGTLRPAIDANTSVAEAKRLATRAGSFLKGRTSSATQAKSTIQQQLGARLRVNPDFTDSIRRRVAGPQAAAKKLREFKVGDEVEIPAYPGFRYRIDTEATVSGDKVERVSTTIIHAPPGQADKVGQFFRIAADRTALPVEKKVVAAGKVFKHEMPRILSRSDDEVEQVVASLIDRWAGTSADNDAWALAIQRAIHDEFGIAEESMRHFQAAGNWLASQEIFAEHGPALRAFARAMWDETQAQLSADGIDEVMLYRGQGFLPDEHFPGVHVDADVRLQPASSFSSRYSTATSFQRTPPAGGGGIISARVPRERILGSARTGFGCLNEGEYVVLGKPAGATDRVVVQMSQPGGIVYAGVDEYWSSAEETLRGARAAVTSVQPELKPSELEAIMDSFNVPLETFDVLDTGLLHVSDALEEDELQAFFNAISQIPVDTLSKIAPEGIYVGHGGVSSLDQMQHLLGTKWDTTAGAYQGGKVIISADLAGTYGTSSTNVFLHEFGHAFGAHYGYDNSGAFLKFYNSLYLDLSPYLRGNPQELFAEGYAMYVSRGYNAVATSFSADFADWLASIIG